MQLKYFINDFRKDIKDYKVFNSLEQIRDKFNVKLEYITPDEFLFSQLTLSELINEVEEDIYSYINLSYFDTVKSSLFPETKPDVLIDFDYNISIELKTFSEINIKLSPLFRYILEYLLNSETEFYLVTPFNVKDLEHFIITISYNLVIVTKGEYYFFKFKKPLLKWDEKIIIWKKFEKTKNIEYLKETIYRLIKSHKIINKFFTSREQLEKTELFSNLVADLEEKYLKHEYERKIKKLLNNSDISFLYEIKDNYRVDKDENGNILVYPKIKVKETEDTYIMDEDEDGNMIVFNKTILDNITKDDKDYCLLLIYDKLKEEENNG